MRAVRNVGDNGRTVVVTIHQPSIELFESFDRCVRHPGGRACACLGMRVARWPLGAGVHACGAIVKG
jgi:hypothetical protein